ncbi:hypothetical protein TH606_03315 [Thermodesulfatator autotrophicus]|uniref:OmpH family outer membrane protein n=1 Tax=Thermodesulfatator autotrophicus TaxID=1795632 RepID=A0A177E8A1_9BACT|nr:hypothetical protein TH606_03315 [Thermodesulfatator autotrophicus]
MKRFFIFFLFLFFLNGVASAEDGFKVTNEMIYKKLLDIEKRQAVLEAEFKEFKKSTNKRF